MATHPAHVLRVNARELLRQPGARRELVAGLEPADLGLDDDRIVGTIDVGLEAVSSIDGIVVRGAVTVGWRGVCRRCLAEVDGVAVIPVDELYQDDLSDDDAYPIEGDQIDMAAPVRDYVVLELPDGPLCRPDCAGICPVCGADRNDAPCTCDTAVRDERWAALDGFEVDDG
ncbi:MAG TPA: DUF177 domain-containing protein [Ilumatobacter sp.]